MIRYLSIALVLVVSLPALAMRPRHPKLSTFPCRTAECLSGLPVEIDLAAISSLPIFGGYTNAESDANHETYIEPICRALGFNSAESTTTGWTNEDRTPEVTVFAFDKSYPFVMNLKSNENISIVRRLKCAIR